MADIRQHLGDLYDTLPNHNYGWWLTTRDHLDVATLVTAAQFLYARFGTNPGSLADNEYDEFQTALGREVPNGGAKTVLNRHLLLNMWRPLGLLERVRINRINPFGLTGLGLNLATTAEPRRLLELILSRMRFVDANWTRPGVMSSYEGISVQPHRLLLAAASNLDGYLERTEYRLFIARLRTDNDVSIDEAIDMIKQYRALSERERSALIALEVPRFPNPKTYQNWVDMDLHTFSLFALGTRFRRHNNVLAMVGTVADSALDFAFLHPDSVVSDPPVAPNNLRNPVRRQVSLRTPDPQPALNIPPPPNIESNSGREAETLVLRSLEANGFEVRDFSRFRGFGFDIWARHKSSGSTYYCEVKSSTSSLNNIAFTRLEVEAAEKYRDSYVLFCVENFSLTEHTGEVWTLQDPWGELSSMQTPTATVAYRAPRSEWISNAQRLG